MALHRYPVLNSTVDPECTAITHRADHNIGIAMDNGRGTDSTQNQASTG